MRHLALAGSCVGSKGGLLQAGEGVSGEGGEADAGAAGQLRKRGRGRGCAVQGRPSCDTIGERLLVLQAGVLDESQGMREGLAKKEAACARLEHNYGVQIEQAELQLKEQEALLAEAEHSLKKATQWSRAAGKMLAKVEEEAARAERQCHEELGAVAKEMAEARSVRKELLRRANVTAEVQDCEVSGWTPGDCDAACGGGAQHLQRTVVAPAGKGGAECPVLLLERSCNEQACPMDCRLGNWSGWSECSAGCGQGTSTRTRAVLAEAGGGDGWDGRTGGWGAGAGVKEKRRSGTGGSASAGSRV